MLTDLEHRYINVILERLSYHLNLPVVSGCIYAHGQDVIQLLAHAVITDQHPGNAEIETYLVTFYPDHSPSAFFRLYDLEDGYLPAFSL